MRRAALVVMLTFGSLAVSGAGDVLQQLGVSSAEASKGVVSSLAWGDVNYASVRKPFKAATPSVRAAMVEQLLVWTKAYVASSQFEQQYAAMKAEAKPRVEEQPTIDEELAARHQQRLDDLEEMRKSVSEVPAEYRKEAEAGYKAAVESLAQLDTAELRKMERDSLELERKEAKAQYEQELEAWGEDYPADPKLLVRRRLEEFLEATSDVDYDAKLVSGGGKMRFANEDYESKSANWKLAYRAGRAATEKARAFASVWLAELD